MQLAALHPTPHDEQATVAEVDVVPGQARGDALWLDHEAAGAPEAETDDRGVGSQAPLGMGRFLDDADPDAIAIVNALETERDFLVAWPPI